MSEVSLKRFYLLYFMMDLLKNFEIGVYRFLQSNSSYIHAWLQICESVESHLRQNGDS